MAYFFTFLLLTSLILLILGLFKPQQSLFWMKADRTKKKSLRIYGIASVVTIAGVALTVPAVADKTKDTPAKTNIPAATAPVAVQDPGASSSVTTEYKLPGSEYVFQVQVSGIQTRLIKDAISIKEDEYVAPEKKDGYELTFTYTITNPYDKEMICPVPEDFYIASPDKKFFSDGTSWDRSCECNINNVSGLTLEDGRELRDIPNTLNCGTTHGYCLTYKPHETKLFNIKFYYPVLASVKKLLLWGFDRKESSGRKMPYDKCWIIDTDSKTFTGEQLYK